MSLDFNDAGEQRVNELIPEGTIAPVHMTVRPGNAGEGGWLKRSKTGECEMLDCEFTVVEGPFAKRKFWGLYVVNGTTDGQQKAVEISVSRLRAAWESAHGIRPDDVSDAAKQKRVVNSYGDLDGLRFVAKIGIERGAQKPNSSEKWDDKNVLAEVITPDRKAWTKVEQIKQQAAPPAQAPTTNKPSWAA